MENSFLIGLCLFIFGVEGHAYIESFSTQTMATEQVLLAPAIIIFLLYLFIVKFIFGIIFKD